MDTLRRAVTASSVLAAATGLMLGTLWWHPWLASGALLDVGVAAMAFSLRRTAAGRSAR
jgi:hypothetical protein